MKNRFFLLIFVSFCLTVSYAQNCASKLSTAQGCERDKDYKCAAYYYNRVAEDCPDYGNAKAKYEECYRKWKESLSTTTQKRPSGGNVPVYQQDSRPVISNKHLFFDEKGESLNTYPNITVSYYDGAMDIINIGNEPDWLKIKQNGNTFVVTCLPNNTLEDRIFEFQIILGEGMDGISDTIRVHQDARTTTARRTSRANYSNHNNNTEQPNNNLSITVKVSFETGKAKPTFENVGKLLGVLEDNKNFGLQIELPWCSEQKSEIYITNKYSMSLMKKRIKNITDYFVNSGIAKERISWSMNESDTECDSGYVKITDLNAGSSK